VKALIAFASGVIFAVGLAIGGMTQPAKIVGFLDFFGRWDPSVLFVMLGALTVHAPAQALLRRRRPAPVLASRYHLPDQRRITPSLVIGSAVFGVGWGLGGYCPGPGIVSMPSLSAEPWIFVAAMSAGILVHHLVRRERRETSPSSSPAVEAPRGIQ
jgi:uncharacterized protein